MTIACLCAFSLIMIEIRALLCRKNPVLALPLHHAACAWNMSVYKTTVAAPFLPFSFMVAHTTSLYVQLKYKKPVSYTHLDVYKRQVHGGGFAGTIQAFVPEKAIPCYKTQIENMFGENTCHVLKIRSDGGKKVL